jgi:Flp pilus assembly protein TadG
MPKTATIRTGIFRRFSASSQGLAAIEFAMILPVLVTLLLASFDGGRAIATYMKVRASTYALAAITNQYSTLQTTDLASITGATSTIMAPYSSSPLVATVSQIWIDSSSNPTVSWSYSLNGTALTAGNPITLPSTSLTTANSFLIYAQVSYTYTPLFGLFGSGGISLADSLYMTPRISTCVLYPSASPAVSSCPTGASSSSGSSGSSGSGSGSSGSGSSGSGSSGSGSSGSGGSGSGSSGSGSGGSGSGCTFFFFGFCWL